MNITVTTQRARRQRHVFMISQSEDSGYHPDDTIIPHNNELNALDTISVHEYSSPKCLPLRKLRKRLLRMLWRGWIMLGLGVVIFVLGLSIGVIYFCIRGATSTLKYTETVPTYVPAILLIVTGILCSVFYWRRYESYAAGSLVLCIIMAPFCAVCAALTSLQHVARIHDLHNCSYRPPMCRCYGVTEIHQYEVTSCPVVFGSLQTYLHVKLGLYCGAATCCSIGAVLCLLLVNFCRPVRHLYSEDDRRLLAEHGVNTMSQNSAFALEEIPDHPSSRRHSIATSPVTGEDAPRQDNIFERLHGDRRIVDPTTARHNHNQQRSSWETMQMSRFISLPGEPRCCLLGIRRNDSIVRNNTSTGNQTGVSQSELSGNQSVMPQSELPGNQSVDEVSVVNEVENVERECSNVENVETRNIEYQENLIREFNLMQERLIRMWLDRCQNLPPDGYHGDINSTGPIQRNSVPQLPVEPLQRRPSQQLPSQPRQRAESVYTIPDQPIRRFMSNQRLPSRPIRRNSTDTQLPPLPLSRRPGNHGRYSNPGLPRASRNPLQVRIDYHERVAPPTIDEVPVNFTDEFYRILRESINSGQTTGCCGNVMLIPVPFVALPEDPPPPYCSRPASVLSGRISVTRDSSSGSSHSSHISITAEIPVA
ncbi:uncharacterized protein LOC141914081 [Tubulanus polymorphus]|uniref:uncharacterized protein LOC141914081 n=1 Tax=Tubulanus polymorphus TaxID=672921 RepID=UPI003DA4E82C